jgi:hypothetical protein
MLQVHRNISIIEPKLKYGTSIVAMDSAILKGKPSNRIVSRVTMKQSKVCLSNQILTHTHINCIPHTIKHHIVCIVIHVKIICTGIES